MCVTCSGQGKDALLRRRDEVIVTLQARGLKAQPGNNDDGSLFVDGTFFYDPDSAETAYRQTVDLHE